MCSSVWYLQLQQQRNDQILLRLLVNVDLAVAANVTQARLVVTTTVHPWLGPAAHITMSGTLMIALLSGLLFMMIGIA